ncbi:MAG: rhamnulokinase [Acidobacteria bacterium]|nr:rhamnulokinase [Acidobacteriota bacterium]
MNDYLYIAIDLGAGSGRVFLCDFDGRFAIAEVHRFAYPPRETGGRLRWDFGLILDEIKTGLKRAAKRAGELGREIYSLGVDSWAVDYGLLDADGRMLGDPVCYRDARTAGVMERVFEKMPGREIYAKTGIQFLNFNTLFQLYAENGALDRAGRLLLLPDLINYHLTGKIVAEYTNATTTQFLNAATRDWDTELLERLGLPAAILPPVVPAGTDLGFLKSELAAELGLENVRVVAPATHDTASAVAGAPLGERQAYISSGTWSLVGVELDRPLVNPEAERFNFTNEGGAYRSIRFLKNVMGLWILESCRREWERIGVRTDYDTLLAEVAKIGSFCGLIYPDDERFLNPESMLGAIEAQLTETGQKTTKNPFYVTKIILDSLAFRYASILRTIEKLTGKALSGVQIVGGGGRNEYLNRMTAAASGLTVQAGLVEATVTGNALVQAIAAGRFADLREGRDFVRRSVALREYAPEAGAATEAAAKIYAALEARFVKV